MINFLKYKKIYFTVSLVFLVLSGISLAMWGLRLSIDFTGGSVLELKLEEAVSCQLSAVSEALEETDSGLVSVQPSGESSCLLRLKPIDDEKRGEVVRALEERFGEIEVLRFETVGPTLGRELLTKTLIAVVLAIVFILSYIAWQFKDKMYGVCAILGMFHDTLILLGYKEVTTKAGKERYDLADDCIAVRRVEWDSSGGTEADFDGVHLNVETVRDGDRSYLLLLEEVRDAIGPGRILSVAGSYWLPKALNELPFAEGFKWSGEYYGAVANQVDQIATMTYDSLMLHPVLYRLWLREQVRGIGRSLADSEVELLIGISVSRERTMTHRPSAENMESGLAGICAGLQGTKCKADGVTVYAAWEANESDWQIWETWLAGTD